MATSARVGAQATGDAIECAGIRPGLSAAEERQLGWAVINDNDASARQILIESHLQLAAQIARKYADRGVPLPDLIERGMAGLVRAVEAYDPAQGARFSTHASWWIKESIRRAVRGDAPAAESVATPSGRAPDPRGR